MKSECMRREAWEGVLEDQEEMDKKKHWYRRKRERRINCNGIKVLEYLREEEH